MEAKPAENGAPADAPSPLPEQDTQPPAAAEDTTKANEEAYYKAHAILFDGPAPQSDSGRIQQYFEAAFPESTASSSIPDSDKTILQVFQQSNQKADVEAYCQASLDLLPQLASPDSGLLLLTLSHSRLLLSRAKQEVSDEISSTLLRTIGESKVKLYDAKESGAAAIYGKCEELVHLGLPDEALELSQQLHDGRAWGPLYTAHLAAVAGKEVQAKDALRGLSALPLSLEEQLAQGLLWIVVGEPKEAQRIVLTLTESAPEDGRVEALKDSVAAAAVPGVEQGGSTPVAVCPTCVVQ